ncbi:DNA polymerase III subunit gamma and tau [Kocuria palustris]|uniref:DNA polymerase III subunit gamma and tau n=1 Tax=Kocuria palustris TaxID=71999 RepID=UPI0011A2936A|nr:DNA polymerase III subunit gamma and tau [Kocuria palustris]
MTTALYRRYRPETFQDVIGQSHVTEPLMTALRKNKVSHAYLFSGPRGCGKTTSARILARCLNCAQGPTPTPCGQCESCRDLAREGAGSLDVIEMDAASHGGVDDARQLRERATFAPVRDRYKIFIIDEAHMVTRDGFNALLKIVEEPPEHIKFIFATTEPNKVLPTIRSRTHHYPFRLVPPEPLMDYLGALCEQEGVQVEPGVQAMVVRAGGGSVRDSLSVLDQLMAGSDDDAISYDLASSLLGYTHGALLDDVVDAFASGDAATVFRAVDRVIQTGQDPRRFVEDLLERFRDLVIVDAVPDSAGNILHGTPEDQIARLRNQSQLMGAAELSRAADITNEALTEMVGATSPQLHLELLCARLLLPSAENTVRGVGVRVDRLERRLSIGRTGAPTGPLLDLPAEQPAQPVGREADEAQPRGQAAPQDDAQDRAAGHRSAEQAAGEQPVQGRASGEQESSQATAAPDRDHQPAHEQAAHGPAAPEQTESGAEGQDGGAQETGPGVQAAAQDEDPLAAVEGGFGKFRGRGPQQPAPGPVDSGPGPSRPGQPPAGGPARPQGPSDAAGAARPGVRTPDQTPERPPHADESAAQGPASGGEIDMIRSSWTEVISALADIHRVSWMTVMRGTPVAFDGSVLQLMFEGEGDRKNFPRFEGNLVQAIQQVIGVSCRVEAVGPGGGSRGGPGGGSRGGGPRDGRGGRGAGPGGPGGPGSSGRSNTPGADRGSLGAGEPGSAPAGRGQDRAPRAAAPERGDPPSGGRPGGHPHDDGRSTDAPPERGRSGDQRDGGRETGPRAFPGPDDRAQPGRRALAPRRPARDEAAPEDSEEVTTWEVAAIPDSDPMASAPSGPDSESTAESASAAAAGHADEAAPSHPAPGAAETTESADSLGAPPAEHSTEPGASAPAERNASGRSQQRPRDQDSSTDDSGAARGPREDGPRPASRGSGEDPSPDPVIPASPYDDIPWSDEPPPEDEPPFEDPGYGGGPPRSDVPRPAGGPSPSTARGTGPAPGTGAPNLAGEGVGAPASGADRASTASVSPSGPPAPSDPDEAPPEQWRPSAPAGRGAPPGGAAGAPAPQQAPAETSTAGAGGAPRKQSFRERHAAHFAAARSAAAPEAAAASSAPDLDSESTFSPSEDDEAVENTDQSTRALIERVLGGRLVEEIPHQPGA